MKKIVGCLLMTLLVFSSIFSLTTFASAKEEKTDDEKFEEKEDKEKKTYEDLFDVKE